MCVVVFLFKHKTAYELRISDWSSDVCSSDLGILPTKKSSPTALRVISQAMAFCPCSQLSSIGLPALSGNAQPGQSKPPGSLLACANEPTSLSGMFCCTNACTLPLIEPRPPAGLRLRSEWRFIGGDLRLSMRTGYNAVAVDCEVRQIATRDIMRTSRTTLV